MIRSQLSRNRVTMLTGTGRFTDDHTVAVTYKVAALDATNKLRQINRLTTG